MQDRYAGDIGDFGKYGMLRSLLSEEEKLGVVWYLTNNESHNNDGKFISYLEPTELNKIKFRNCDIELYDILGKMIREGERSVASIQELNILPGDVKYYDMPLSFDGLISKRGKINESRGELRLKWIKDAIEKMNDRQSIFIDPDNGITGNNKAISPKGNKYTTLEDMKKFSEYDKTLIVYHHTSRQGTAKFQLENLIKDTTNYLDRECWALMYHRGSVRGYIIIPSNKLIKEIKERTTTFINSSWGQHFDIII